MIGTRERVKLSVRLFVSRIAFPETLSAIRKQKNIGAIKAREATRLSLEVLEDFVYAPSPYLIHDTTEAVVGHAAMLVIQHGLRAYDAVHLATALRIRAGLPDGSEFVFVSADHRLNNVARAERFTVFDPTPPALAPPSMN
jgi:predicted nucleic acid-binding protein